MTIYYKVNNTAKGNKYNTLSIEGQEYKVDAINGTFFFVSLQSINY